jgi:hypothetical protein
MLLLKVRCGWGTEMRDSIAERTVQLLRDMGELPTTTTPEEEPDVKVGLDAKLKGVVEHLQPVAPGECRMLLLHGMGGIGKTTLARAVFNQQLQADPMLTCCFVSLDPDTDEVGIVQKQRQLLHGLAHVEGPILDTAHQGRMLLAEKLLGKKVLLVVDNVWGAQLKELLPRKIMEMLAEGSMVLVTSREAGAVEDFGEVQVVVSETDAKVVARPSCVFKMATNGLSVEQATELLCRHAFNCTAPPADDEAHVRKVVVLCGGLPMAVEVVGRYLKHLGARQHDFYSRIDEYLPSVYKHQRADWRCATMFDVLRLSWDALGAMDTRDQEDLVDIAWFLRGQQWERVECVCEVGGLNRLEQAGLVKRVRLQNFGTVQMVVDVHDSVVQFCKQEVSGAGPKAHDRSHEKPHHLASAAETRRIIRLDTLSQVSFSWTCHHMTWQSCGTRK